MGHIRTLIDQANQRFSSLPPSGKKTAVYSIGTALSIVVIYWTVKKCTSPPKQLAHLPHINFFKLVQMMMIQKEPYGSISKQLAIPLLQPGAVGYVKTDTLGWTLQITDPEAAKEFFLKTGKSSA
jgi:hypothetical protein